MARWNEDRERWSEGRERGDEERRWREEGWRNRDWREDERGDDWRVGSWRGGERGEWHGGAREWEGRDRDREWDRDRDWRTGDRGGYRGMFRRGLTGRGPKGYKRSDERIREDVSERIARSWVNAEEVEVKVENGEVTFTGFVGSREEKRMIEDLADDVFGVDDVHNHVRLHREGETQSTPTGTGQTQQPGARH